MADAIDMANEGPLTFKPVEDAKPEAADYEALVASLTTQLEAAQAELVKFRGPEYAGLCQFRAADGRVCLTLYADGRIEKGEGFPDNDAASVAFFDSMARNLAGHLQNRENRVIAAEVEATAHRGRVDQLSAQVSALTGQVAVLEGERLQARHQVAVAEAKATALLEARGKG